MVKNIYGFERTRIDKIYTKEFILAEITIGDGVEGDPVRPALQIWDFNGKLIAEVDKYKEQLDI